jgi:nitroreductase
MLLMAHAMGFGAALTSGQSLASAPLRRLFSLSEHEQALCFVNIGSVVKSRPVRVRPSVAEYVTTLTANQDTIE